MRDADRERPTRRRPEPLCVALETINIDRIKGKVSVRACDHQALPQGFLVKVGKKDGYDMPVSEIIATHPSDCITPGRKRKSFDD